MTVRLVVDLPGVARERIDDDRGDSGIKIDMVVSKQFLFYV